MTETRVGLRAGAALFAAGEYHAAHDPLETVWLELDAGDDERLFHGLIQYTAAVFHASRGNWSGAAGLGESAAGYLSAVDNARSVAVGPIERFCRELSADPAVIDCRRPPPIRIDNEPVSYETLSPPAVWAASRAVADEYGYDDTVVADAISFARADRSRGDDGPATSTGTFTRFLRAFLTAGDDRGVVFERLASHVDRRQRQYDDLDGLFE